ncbi:hypothetical protein [Acinetobacter haemolyticus]|uniref:hypothetical protein n=1 Tax=Acinetobacter haemolyticus TaxID=29430 RepID=UPI00325AA0CC
MIGKGIVFRDSASRMAVITGVVMELGSPVIRQVRAYSRTSGALLESTYSNKDGKYKMYLPLDTAYTIVSIDSNKNFNAVIQDNVVPK